MITSYEEAVQFLYQNLPMYQRVGAVAYKPDLANTLKLCEALDNPQNKFRSVHVGGTNGKGSTSHMLAAILQSAGYKTGLHTSPHLKRFTERIRIGNQEVPQQFVIDFVNKVRPLVEQIHPSFFEISVVMAFDYFASQKVDVAIIEVGLGGRLDSTNVITPLLSVITNIGWDHKDILGDNLQLIAAEKAGIIKRNIPVIISERNAEVDQIFIDKAKEMHAPITFAADSFPVELQTKNGVHYYNIHNGDQSVFHHVTVGLQGLYQQKNLQGVIAAVYRLRAMGFSIADKAVESGLRHVISLTNFKGRWQKLSEAPLMICDTGHNIDGIKEILRQINLLRVTHVHMILGMVKDKDIDDVLQLLPKQASYYFCQARIPRALDAATLAEKAGKYGLKGEVIQNVNEAIRTALILARETDLIFIGGSTFVVAEIDGL